ncbi:MAG TPA: zf-HC2 domain-containing protein [Actinoplanes sp.]|nr:zf-HC2 domain-containing protein [Actinoplanes sp.]
MTDTHSTDPGHAQLRSCAAYLLGGLDAETEQEFERHLATCVLCLDECDRLGPLVTSFGDFSPEEAAALSATFPNSPGSASEMSRFSAGSVSESASRSEAKSPGSRPASRPPTPGIRNRRRRRMTMASLAVIAMVSFGTAAILATGEAPETVTTRPVAVTAEGVGGSAHLSVSVTEAANVQPSTAEITATVSGLVEGQKYRLYAVTGDGESLQVAEWTADDTPQEVTGDAEVAVADLFFFSVTLTGGRAVVSARVAR